MFSSAREVTSSILVIWITPWKTYSASSIHLALCLQGAQVSEAYLLLRAPVDEVRELLWAYFIGTILTAKSKTVQPELSPYHVYC